MKSIQRQQLELAFGDAFKEAYANTRSYVKGLIGKSSWWVSQKQLLENEGPLSQMVEHCMLYILEEGGRTEGYKAYTSYLTKEYGTSQTRNTRHADIDVLRYTPATTAPSPSLEAQTPVERKVGENEDDLPPWLTKEQADFLYMHTKMGMPETARMLGIDEQSAWNKYRSIKNKVRYHAQKS